MKTTDTKTIFVELPSGKEFEIEVTAHGAYDANYGADADGNRGMAMWEVDELTFDLPKVDDDGNDLTIDELHDLDIAVHKLALDEDWEFSIENEYEYDPELGQDFSEGDENA